MADPPNEFQQGIINARADGRTWPQINAFVSQAYDKAIADHRTPDEIAAYMGYKPDPSQAPRMAAEAKATYNANAPTLPATASPLDNFVAGVKASSGGLIAQTAAGRTAGGQGDKAFENWQVNPHADMWSRLLYEGGTMFGDVPAMVAGAVGAGGAAIETGPGAVAAAGAGAFALPYHIKQEYADSLSRGSVTGPADYVARQAAVWAGTFRQAAVGALTAETGAGVGSALKTAGVAAIPRVAITASAELGVMMGSTAAMEGKLPSKEELIDSALLMATAHGVIHLSKAAVAPAVVASTDNLSQNWVTTGEMPQDAAIRAYNDNPTIQAFNTPRETPRWLPPGSTTVAHGASPASHLTIQRIPGNFEAGVSFILKEEGGAQVRDANGAQVKWGINARDYPHVDLPNLSKQGAVDIYHRDYWTPMHIDSLPDNMKLPVFDAAVVEGVGKAREMLAESGNDPVKFSELRKAHYESLVEKDPAKYGRFLKTWLGRIDRSMGGVKLSDGYDLATELGGGESPSPEELKGFDMHEDERGAPGFLSKFIGDESGAVGGKTPPIEPPEPYAGREKDDRNPGDLVAAQFGDASTNEKFGDKISRMGAKAYIEMMNPEHPVGKLVQAVTDGGPLEAAKNPMFLMRLAESSESTAKYMIEKGMLNEKGDVVGPGLKPIIAGAEARTEPGLTHWTYWGSKFALEKAKQGRETGIDLGAATQVVQDVEGQFPRPEGLKAEDVAAAIRTKINYLDPSHPMMAYGPHFRIDTNEVNMLKGTEADYAKAFGRGLTPDVVLQHEVGHAVAFDIATKFGNGTWDNITRDQYRELADELTIVSRRFKPGLWADRAQASHVSKNSELIADAVATWFSDPVARTHMPEFQKLMATEAPGYDLEKNLGAVPDQWGHPWEQAFEQLQDFQNSTFKLAYRAGVTSRESYLRSVAMNRAYIPGQREQDMLHPNASGTPTGKTPFNPIGKFEGSDLKIKNVYESLLRNTFLRVSLAQHNLVNQAVTDAALGVVDPTTGQAMARVVRGDGTKPDGLGHNGGPSLNADDLADHLDPDMDVTVAQLLGKSLARDEVPVMRDGIMTKVVFADPEMAPLLKGLNNQGLSIWGKIMRGAASFQRTMIVLNPAFPIHLMQYDLPFQFITKPGFRNVIAQAMIGGREVFTHGEVWDEWMRRGAPDRILDGLSKNEYLKHELKGQGDPHLLDGVFNLVSSTVRALRAWNMAMAQVMPVGRYAMETRRGTPTEQAAWEASESPFHRSGAMGPEAKKMNTGIPFFTAYLNGLEKNIRANLGMARPGEPAINPFHTFAKSVAMVTVPILLNELSNHDKEWYKQLPAVVKDNCFTIHIGPDWEKTKDADGNDSWIQHGVTIPWKYPPITSQLFGMLPRRMMEQFLYDNPHAWDDLDKSTEAGFAPPGALIPSLILPFLEHGANHSFFGDHPLVNDSARKGLNTQDQYTAYTSTAAIALSKVINHVPVLSGMKFSPPVVDNYIKEFGGTWGQILSKIVDTGAQALGLAKQRDAAPHWNDNPLVSSFIYRYPDFKVQSVMDFDSTMGRFDKVHGELAQAYTEDNFDKFQQILADNPKAVGLQSYATQNVAGPADPDKYDAAYQAAADRLSPESESWLEAARAVQGFEKTVKYIESLPTTRSSPDDPHAVTPIEKRQMHDQALGTVFAFSEEANKRAAAAGIK